MVTKRHVDGSKFKMYKAKTVINRPIEVIFEVLLDVPAYPEWVPDVRKAYIVEMLDKDRIKGNLIIHLDYDVIWPVKNRDVVMKVSSAINWETGYGHVTLTDTREHTIPVKKGVERIKDLYGLFEFKYIDRNTTDVTYTFYADPGGKVPAGLTTIQASTVSWKTLRNLSKIAEKPIYYQQAMRDYY